jgi:hypothetical protein
VTLAIEIVGVALGVSVLVVAIVAIGTRGGGSKLSRGLAATTRHLSGEADPPAGLVAFFEKARSAASAVSARSAASATEDHPPQ